MTQFIGTGHSLAASVSAIGQCLAHYQQNCTLPNLRQNRSFAQSLGKYRSFSFFLFAWFRLALLIYAFLSIQNRQNTLLTALSV